MSGLRLVSPVITLGAPHCCACTAYCHHIGPARWCETHKPPVLERLAHLGLNVRSTA